MGPTEADTVEVDALAAGATVTRSVSLALPVEAILYARPVRADAAVALGFDPEAPTLAPIEVARARAE